MENFIFTSVPIDQLQTAIKEAVKSEFLKINNIPPPEEVEYITRKETAQILGVSLPTLNEYTKTGTIQGYKCGARSIRYRKSEVLGSFEKLQQVKFKRGL